MDWPRFLNSGLSSRGIQRNWGFLQVRSRALCHMSARYEELTRWFLKQLTSDGWLGH